MEMNTIYQDNPTGSRGMATAALILGVCSLVFCICGGGLVFGALGIILALLSRGGETMNSTAKIGLGLSVAALSLSVVVYSVAVFSIAPTVSGSYDSSKTFEENYENIMRDYLERIYGQNGIPYSFESNTDSLYESRYGAEKKDGLTVLPFSQNDPKANIEKISHQTVYEYDRESDIYIDIPVFYADRPSAP